MTTSVADPAAAPQPTDPGRKKDFRYDIGGLRGLAIIIVVIGHVFERSGLLKWPDWIDTFVNYAAYQLDKVPVDLDVIHIHGGVDMSFALSGYLITWLAIREFIKYGRMHMKAFYGRRARRLLPAATLVTLATLAASYYWLSPLRLREIAGDAVATSLPVPLLNYWLGYQATDYFATDHVATTPFQHYWSLNVEEQFYLVYPALLLLALVIGRKIGRLRLTVGIMLAVIVVVSLTWSIIQTDTNYPMAYFGAHTRAWELALGALVAVAQPLFKRLPQAIAAALSWFGLATVLVTICIIENYPLPGFAVGGPVLGVLMVIAGGEARPRRSAEMVLRFKPLQYIGKISYQWYLWHWPVLIILPAVFDIETLQLADAIGVLVVSFILAALTWHFVDTPIRKRKDMDEKPGKAIGMGVHLMIAALVASLVTMFVAAPSTTANPRASAPSANPSASTGDNNGFTPLTTPERPVSELPNLIAEATQLKKLPTDIEGLLPNINKLDGLDGCLTLYEVIEPDPCPIGDQSASKTVVMLGDSHTTHWKQAMDAIGKKHRIKVVTYTKQSCPAEPYVHIDTSRKSRYTQCEKWREIAYKQIEALRPMAVIFSSRVWDDLTAEAVTQATKRFTAQNIPVVALGNTPRPAERVPDCLAQYPDNVQRCTMDRTEATNEPELREARKQASVAAGALYIDPMDWFCTNTKCPVVINNMLVYFDAAHITRTYADWVSPKLDAALAPVLK